MAWFLGLLLAFGVSAASTQAAAPEAVPQGLSWPAGTVVYQVVSPSAAAYVVRARSFFFPETVHGRGGVVSGEIRLVEGPSPSVSGDLEIAAATLDSGKGARDKQVRSTLHAAEHPAIVFTITGVDPFSLADLDAAGLTVTAHGYLQVAGTAVPLSFPVFARREGGKRLLMVGTARTGFKDLKLDAPGMAFLVMVQDAIDAGADIVADRVP
jgi:polyisoprenoid-binding protein YceI